MHISSNEDDSGEHVKYAATCQKDLGAYYHLKPYCKGIFK